MKLTQLLYAVPNNEEEQGFSFMLIPERHKWWMSDSDIYLGVVETYCETPDNISKAELATKAIDTLKAKQEKIRADAFVEIAKLDEKLKELQLLVHIDSESPTYHTVEPEHPDATVAYHSFEEDTPF